MTGSIKVRHLGLMVLAFVMCVALIGCGGAAVTKENADKVKADMTLAEVEKVMGKGTEVKKEDFKKVSGQDMELPEGMKVYRWGDDSKSLTVTFLNDKAKGIFKKNL